MVERVLLTVERDYPGVDEFRTSAETIRRLIGVWIDDLVWESGNRIAAAKPQSVEDVRAAGKPLIGFSDVMNEHQAVLRRFLMARMYRHWKVNRSRSHAKRIIRQLFDLFLAEPELLPPAGKQGGDGAAWSAHGAPRLRLYRRHDRRFRDRRASTPFKLER